MISRIEERLDRIPGIRTEILQLEMGPSSGKPVQLRLKGENWDDLLAATQIVEDRFEAMPGLIDVEDTLPLPGIDWQIDVDVEKAGRYGADVATVGAMVQMVTRGILLDTMRVESSDEEIDIRVRLPRPTACCPRSTRSRCAPETAWCRCPISSPASRFRSSARSTGSTRSAISCVKGDVAPGLVKLLDDGDVVGVVTAEEAATRTDLQQVPVNTNERIAAMTEWLETDPLPAGISYEWTGDQEDQAESGQFLISAFIGALGLMFVILLAQFNSFYNSVLVLLAVVLSTTGVLIGMLVMDQAFSIIMTGTGIVALAGIVVNNNIVLIDTYQEYNQYMPRIEAIVRTAETRIRPVLLTTITTMAGLAPMMFGLSLDFFGGGYTIDSPTALWWKQLATAVVFGLGIATVLTLVFTPSMLALRIWSGTIMAWISTQIQLRIMGRDSQIRRDLDLDRAARHTGPTDIVWDTDTPQDTRDTAIPPLRAAE